MQSSYEPDLTHQDYVRLAAFRHALRQFLAFSEARAKSAGLLPQQHQALLAIRGKLAAPAMSIGELAAFLMIRHHSAVELVDRMVDAGLVQRSSDPADRRRSLVMLTERAESLLHELSAQHLAELRAIRPTLLTLLDGF
jgi:DNA-binding MarR family transcriptional regulator